MRFQLAKMRLTIFSSALSDVTADNFALGHTVITYCVNPWPLTRDAWQQVGQQGHVRATASDLKGNCRIS